MALNRVNLSVDREVWDEFKVIVPEWQKSRIIMELLREEIRQRKKQARLAALMQDFKKPADDDRRWAEAAEWDPIDIEGWDE